MTRIGHHSANRYVDGLTGVFIAAALVIVGATAYLILGRQLTPQTALRLGDGVFSATIHHVARGAATPVNDDNLEINQATLLVYSQDQFQTIDTSKTLRPVDIVWLDKDKKVVFIVKGASADMNGARQYTSKSAARYVVELPAGTVRTKSINIGGLAVFDEHPVQE